MNFSISETGYTMTAEAQLIGPDLLVIITGGSNPHIGAVTTLSPTEPMQTMSFPSHDGRRHKDGVLAERLARFVKADLRGSLTITSGVHVNQITKQQIEAANGMADELGRQIDQWLIQQPVAEAAQYYQNGEKAK